MGPKHRLRQIKRSPPFRWRRKDAVLSRIYRPPKRHLHFPQVFWKGLCRVRLFLLLRMPTQILTYRHRALAKVKFVSEMLDSINEGVFVTTLDEASMSEAVLLNNYTVVGGAINLNADLEERGIKKPKNPRPTNKADKVGSRRGASCWK